MQLHDVLRLSAGALCLLLIALFTFARRRIARHDGRALLATIQIALATLLVICAALLARSAVQLRALDPGVASGTAARIL